VNFPAAPRRPSRVAAVALLLILHFVAIELFVHLRATQYRPSEPLVALLRLARKKPEPVTQAVPAQPFHPPRALVAPAPPLDVEPPASIHDSATPIAGPESGTAPPGTAASMPGPARLALRIPKEFYVQPKLTPAQEAMQDPRSNRRVLTRREQMDVDFGVVECIAWQRLPDGSIYRGPGHRQRIQGISTNPFTSHKPGYEDRSEECVR
jgi:hypothetical protein